MFPHDPIRIRRIVNDEELIVPADRDLEKPYSRSAYALIIGGVGIAVIAVDELGADG
jgi:hypothetical protein